MVEMARENCCKLCEESRPDTFVISQKLLGKDLLTVIENITSIQLRTFYPYAGELLVCQKCALGLIQAESMIEKIRRALSNIATDSKAKNSQNQSSKPKSQSKSKKTTNQTNNFQDVTITQKKNKQENETIIDGGESNISRISNLNESKLSVVPNNASLNGNTTNNTERLKEPIKRVSVKKADENSAKKRRTENLSKSNNLEGSLRGFSSNKDITQNDSLIQENNPKSNSSASKTKDLGDYHFKCQQCSFESQLPAIFKSHLIKEHGIEKPRIFKCPQCTETYQMSHRLQQHISYVHEKKPRPRNFVCDKCNKAFFHRSALQTHLETHVDSKTHVEVTPALSEKSFQRSTEKDCSNVDLTVTENKIPEGLSHSTPLSPKKKEKSSVSKPLVCTLCGKAFSRESSLQLHFTRRHWGDKRKECPNCGGIFNSQHKFEKHIFNEKCSGDKQFACQSSLCSKSFRSVSKMQHHMIKTHPLELKTELN